MYLINKNKAAQNIVKGKDIIVILGVTGAGKSTLVQMMLGYKQVLQKGTLHNKQLTTLVPVGGLKN
jgi:ABC-type Mn2+/Zn2+ transport system ATPase subunit